MVLNLPHLQFEPYVVTFSVSYVWKEDSYSNITMKKSGKYYLTLVIKSTSTVINYVNSTYHYCYDENSTLPLLSLCLWIFHFTICNTQQYFLKVWYRNNCVIFVHEIQIHIYFYLIQQFCVTSLVKWSFCATQLNVHSQKSNNSKCCRSLYLQELWYSFPYFFVQVLISS